jgi:cobalt/nickel transport system ATP-binding protein
MSCRVSIRDLGFAYESGPPVLGEVSLEVEAGERLGVIGPSGAGKSTLMLHLNGILTPTSGSVHVGDLSVGPSTLEEVRRRVGLVFQDPDDQLFNPTVYEDVAFGPRNMGMTREEVDRAVRRTLNHLGLEGKEEASSHHLSYGERKRVALATVLSMRPEVVALDEPFSNLHPAMVDQLGELIRGLDATVILISQALLPLTVACDRIAILDGGRIRAVGSTAEILSDRPLLRSCGLDFHHFHQRLHELMGLIPPEDGGHRHE